MLGTQTHYRDVLLDGRPAARLVFLDIGHDADMTRLAARHGHFFPARLLDTQFDDLEMPRAAANVLVVPADGTPEELVATIIRRLNVADAAGG